MAVREMVAKPLRLIGVRHQSRPATQSGKMPSILPLSKPPVFYGELQKAHDPVVPGLFLDSEGVEISL